MIDHAFHKPAFRMTRQKSTKQGRMTGEGNSLLEQGEEPATFSKLAKQVLANSIGSTSWFVIEIGLLGLISSVYYALLTNDIILFTGHPIFNLLGLFALVNGIVIVQPAPLSSKHKTVGGALHGLINSASSVLFFIGFSFIFYNKYSHAADHFTTWHAFFGIITYLSLALFTGFGAIMFWLPETVFGSVAKAKSFYKYHRIGGYLLIILLSTTIVLALPSDYNQSTLHINKFTLIGSILLILVGLFSRLNPAKVRF